MSICVGIYTDDSSGGIVYKMINSRWFLMSMAKGAPMFKITLVGSSEWKPPGWFSGERVGLMTWWL